MSNVSGIVKSTRNIMRQDTGTGSDELRILQHIENYEYFINY